MLPRGMRLVTPKTANGSNNEAAAEYTVQLSMATASEDVGVQLFVDDKEITDVIKAEKGEDWSTYSTVTAKTKEIAKGEHVLKMKIVGNFVNVDWIKFCKEADCKDNVGIRTARVNLQIPEKIYAVFGMTGKFLGNVEVNGQSIAKSIRSAGFTPGVYMVRSAGQSKTFRVLVK